MDVGKSTFLTGEKYTFMEQNQEAVKRVVRPTDVRDSDWSLKETKRHYKRIVKTRKRITNEGISYGGFAEFTKTQNEEKLEKEVVAQLWRSMSEKERSQMNPRRLPDSVDVVFHPSNTLGALPEKLLDSIHNYIKENESGSEFESVLFWKGMN